MSYRDSKTALVLGSGGARGLAHIGVIKALEENKVPVNMIAGTSIGALIGGLYAAGMPLKKMEKIVEETDKITVAKIFIPKLFAPGFVDNKRAMNFIAGLVGDVKIEDLKIPFAAVATDLMSGEEIVFTKGPLSEAIMASISIPTIFNPVLLNSRYLIDGGLCNPLPINVAKKMGAKKIIAVNVSPNPKRITKKIKTQKSREYKNLIKQLPQLLADFLADNNLQIPYLNSVIKGNKKKESIDPFSPSIFNVFLQSISISTNSLITLNLQNNKPDILISPPIEDYDMLDFFKGAEIIKRGYESAKEVVRV